MIFWSSALLSAKFAFATAGTDCRKLCFIPTVALFLSSLLNRITAHWQKGNRKHQCRLHFSQGQNI